MFLFKMNVLFRGLMSAALTLSCANTLSFELPDSSSDNHFSLTLYLVTDIVRPVGKPSAALNKVNALKTVVIKVH